MRHGNPQTTLEQLITERYSKAICIIWGGSVAKNQGTPSSDLDLIVIYDSLPNAYREAFVYANWPIDAFVHDPETLVYFLTQVDPPSTGLATMLAEGTELTASSPLSQRLKAQARSLLTQRPTLKPNELDNRRFQITDLLNDLGVTQPPHEQWATRTELYRQLAEYYLLTNGQWLAAGKTLARALESYNVNMAQRFLDAFSKGEYKEVEQLTLNVLDRQGGLLWDGYRSEAPATFRIPKEVL